jgi:predicted  nucleic acid-binding Zn-ribbon protein
MIEYYEEQLDITKSRIIELEKNISILQENVMTAIEQIKETQRFLVKLAHNQAEISKRVSAWPYIVVSHQDKDD